MIVLHDEDRGEREPDAIRCVNCKHWGKQRTGRFIGQSEFRRCLKMGGLDTRYLDMTPDQIREYAESGEKREYRDAQDLVEMRYRKALAVVDHYDIEVTGHYIGFVTRPDFGCVLWEGK